MQYNFKFNNTVLTPRPNTDNTGLNDWQPGRKPSAVNHKSQVPQPDILVIRRIGDALINWFLSESPSADYVSIIPDSLQLIDPAYNIWKAKVLTTIYMKKIEQRHHESSVRFRIVYSGTRYAIFHNYLVFP